jgi:hypothetical protein
VTNSSALRICSNETIYTIKKPTVTNSLGTAPTYQTQIYPNGDSYFGQLSNDKPSGYGTYSFKKSGDKYEGYFSNGLRYGSGKYTFKNGNYFVGNYNNNRRDGPGKEYNSAGVILVDGIWLNGTMVSSQPKVPESSSNQEKSAIENKPNKTVEQRCLSLGLKEGSTNFNKCLRSLSKE